MFVSVSTNQSRSKKETMENVIAELQDLKKTVNHLRRRL